jgi:hypothetical protein
LNITPETVVRQAPEITSGDVGGEIVLLGIRQGKYYGLNGVASRIWVLIESPLAVSSLTRTLIGEFEVAPDICERETVALLAGLAQEGLVTIVGQTADKAASVSS